MKDTKILLASASPRRRELIALLRRDFDYITVDIDESIVPGTPPDAAAESNAVRKALAAKELACAEGKFIVSADTVVALDGKIYGKPTDEKDAFAMLRALSGREHEVFTGVCIISPSGKSISFCERSAVRFLELSNEEILDYIATNEPMDKAGAYGIQGYGSLLISGIEGDFFNIMGLPVSRLNRMLKLCEKYENEENPNEESSL